MEGKMGEITLIFVATKGIIGNIIRKVTRGKFSHVAGLMFNSTLEAYGWKLEDDPYPGVWLHSPWRYSLRDPNVVFVDVEIPDIKGAEFEARRLIGAPYGYIDLLAAGIYNLFRIDLRTSGRHISICSEVWVRILRAGGVEVLPGVEADAIAPMDLYRTLSKPISTRESIVSKK
jgi:hypothetical protein